jgi:hypothetical protein
MRRSAVARGDIPYRSQYASPELAAEFQAGRLAFADDPRWEESGARSREEYVRWARSGCGMACLQMILEARDGAAPSIAALGRAAIGFGAYEERPARGFGPLVYAPFVDFVAAEFGLSARVAAPITLEELMAAVAGDEVVLASVSAEIRSLTARPQHLGGHLVLAYDVSPDSSEVCFHDPAGDRRERTRGVWLEDRDFARFFANRGIAVRLPRP